MYDMHYGYHAYNTLFTRTARSCFSSHTSPFFNIHLSQHYHRYHRLLRTTISMMMLILFFLSLITCISTLHAMGTEEQDWVITSPVDKNPAPQNNENTLSFNDADLITPDDLEKEQTPPHQPYHSQAQALAAIAQQLSKTPSDQQSPHTTLTTKTITGRAPTPYPHQQQPYEDDFTASATPPLPQKPPYTDETALLESKRKTQETKRDRCSCCFW